MMFDDAMRKARKVFDECGWGEWCSQHDKCNNCEKDALDMLQAAHDEEINHVRKAEYHRGYEDGKVSKDADERQLEQQRHYVAKRLREYRDAPPVQTLEMGNGDAIEVDAYTFGGILSAIMYPVTEFPTATFIDRLIYLLVGESPENAHPSIYKNERKLKTGTESNASTLQKSPDLTNCNELHRLLRKTIGEVKCVHDTLRDKMGAHANLKAECRMYRDMLNDAAIDYVRLMDECDELRMDCTEYNLAITGYRERMAAFEESERLRRELETERDELRRNVGMWRDRANDMRKERDELNAYANDQHEKLREAELKIQQLESQCDMESNSCSKAIDERDKYKAACEAAQSLNRDMMDGLKNYMELPKDADGKHVHVGDVMSWEGTGKPFKVSQITLCANDDTYISDEEHPDHLFKAAHFKHVTKPDPIEEVFREYELGSITGSQAVEKIRKATASR